MITLALSEIAEIVGGELIVGASGVSPETTVSGAVDTDSRVIRDGGIFVAKPGEVTDGHLFIDAAIENGASLVIAQRAVEASVPIIVVPDTVDALGAFARAVVARVAFEGDLTVIGITGSNGKTTTKNLVRTILERVGKTIAPRASYNNEVGAPLTMLELEDDTKFLVLEMGASNKGDIARLVHMARPDIGVVLTVGLAHAGEFGGIEATFEAKSEMVTDLEPDALAVLNRDDSRVAAMAEKTRARVRWFGLGAGAEIRATDVTSSREGTRWTLHVPGEEPRKITFRVLGEHHVMNALAATGVACEIGVPVDDIVSALESVSLAERWRMQVLGGARGITVINDAYNASPDSMAAALKTLAQITPPGQRKIAVLGAMSELGDLAGAEHDRVGLQAVRLGIDQLVVVGEEARRIHISAINEGSWDGESVYCETLDDAFDYVKDTVQDGDTILVKSSNAAELRFLGDRIGELFT